MERDSSKHSEYSPLSSEDETDSSSETDKKKKKKAQSDDVSVWSRINPAETKPDDSKPKTAERLGTLWHHETEKTKEPENKDLTPEQEAADEDQLEHLSQSEVKEVSEAYLTARRQEIALELTQLPDDGGEQSDAQAALAADTYLAAVENKLRTEPEADINDATDEAYAEAIRSFAPENLSSDTIPHDNDIEVEPEDSDDEDDGRKPPSWRPRSFPPGGFPSFGSGSTNTVGNSETIIERDYGAERVAAVRGLLVGGIIGYLIGRRRGRIKTEKRLIPIQKKLEQEVQSLYSTISVKETQLRTLVKQRDNSRRLGRQEGFASETFSTNQKQAGGETLKTDKSRSTETINPPSSSVEIVNRENLLKAGEKITIGTTTLRKVFETGLISERGLRRAVEEYSKGGDIRRVLAEEVLIKELGYELDPLLRDRPLTNTVDPLSSPVTQQRASHAQAAASIQGHATIPSSNIDDSLLPPPPVDKRSIPSLLITANVLALLVLAVLVLILLITRK